MSKHKGYAPVRTCISCGARNNKKKMIRLVLDDDGFVVRDVDGKGRGRGAYVCPDIACLRAVPKGNKLSRVFRKNGLIRIHPDLNV